MYTDTHAKELALLNYIEHNAHATQRELSEQVGMSLGAINLLLKTLIKKGFVKVEKLTPNSVKYFLTPAGIADKLERTYSYIVRTYREIDHMRNRIVTVTNNLASLHQADKILFYGPKDDFSLMVIDLVSIQSFATDVRVYHSVEKVRGESSAPIIIWREDDELALKEIGVNSVNLLGMVSVLGPKEIALYK